MWVYCFFEVIAMMCIFECSVEAHQTMEFFKKKLIMTKSYIINKKKSEPHDEARRQKKKTKRQRKTFQIRQEKQWQV